MQKLILKNTNLLLRQFSENSPCDNRNLDEDKGHVSCFLTPFAIPIWEVNSPKNANSFLSERQFKIDEKKTSP